MKNGCPLRKGGYWCKVKKAKCVSDSCSLYHERRVKRSRKLSEMKEAE
jgi:hypothetical protein